MRDMRRKGGCLGLPGSTLWLFFTMMWFFTEPGAIPVGKWEFLWRFLAGPINFVF
ncbi:MAG: hypothetical protein O2913_13625 [Chloroflexi bacterium]|nr:hypothetical protein [Chloroflexota bacterium]